MPYLEEDQERKA